MPRSTFLGGGVRSSGVISLSGEVSLNYLSATTSGSRTDQHPRERKEAGTMPSTVKGAASPWFPGAGS
jgi:hypothetical protein